MGFYVFILVAFPCNHNDGVAALASKYVGLLGSQVPDAEDWPPLGDLQKDGQWEAGCFLSDLARRTGENRGPKGGVSSWGFVGNYTDVRAFVDVLKPFWLDLLGGGPDGEIHGGPNDFEHVIVFGEQEGSGKATAWEISRREDADGNTHELVIKETAAPFCWNQY